MLQKLAEGLLALYFKKSHLGLKPFPLKSARKAISPILQKITLGLKPFPLKSARKAISPMLLKVTNKLLALSFKIYL